MTHTVLIVEDEERIAHWLETYFQRAGFSASVAQDGEVGLAMALANPFDIIILDLMLPKLDGITLCQTLRKTSDVPIIMLTAKGTVEDRINGIETGADDYVVKPFDPEEVVVRAKAILRRITSIKQAQLTYDTITLNEDSRTVTIDNKPINLSQHQFALLETFMRHPNQVLTREQIIALTFADEFDSFDRAIDTHIRRLRKLIEPNTKQPRFIHTVYGAGYKFMATQ